MCFLLKRKEEEEEEEEEKDSEYSTVLYPHRSPALVG